MEGPNDDWTKRQKLKGRNKEQSCGYEFCVRKLVSTVHEITERQDGRCHMGRLEVLMVVADCKATRNKITSKHVNGLLDLLLSKAVEESDGSMRSRRDLVSSGEARYARHIVIFEAGLMIGEKGSQIVSCYSKIHDLLGAGHISVTVACPNLELTSRILPSMAQEP